MFFIRVILVATYLFLSGCSLDTSAIVPPAPPANPVFEVRPNVICSGEEVRASWDVTRASKRSVNCAHPNGGYESSIPCLSSDGCPPSGATCLDGMCIRREVDPQEVDFGSGCMPDSVFSISTNPPLVPNPLIDESALKEGEASATIPDTTQFTGHYVQVGPIYTQDIAQEVLALSPSSHAPITMRFEYQGAECALTSVNFDALDIFPSDQIQIIAVINRSGQEIILSRSDPDVDWIPLVDNERTDDFNGPAKGDWHAVPTMPAVVPPSGSGGTQDRTCPDPLEIAIYLSCEPPD